MTSFYNIGKLWCRRCNTWLLPQQVTYEHGGQALCVKCHHRVRMNGRCHNQKSNPVKFKDQILWDTPLLRSLAKATGITESGLRYDIKLLAQSQDIKLPTVNDTISRILPANQQILKVQK